ncbi:ankyrin repeat domain-containing protein, partial [Methylicorpusculum sp.]|uniref:ankyrin repeat domain-containing protein n=1 Tax=Methylicorpusculum sp. TaxID=2713644 RepID=UPI002AB9F39D
AARNGHVAMTEFLSEQSNETIHTPFIVNPLAIAIAGGHTQATDIILKTHYALARETPQVEQNADEWPLTELRRSDEKRRGLTPTQQNAFEWPLLYAAEFEHNDILEKIAQTPGTIIDAYDRHSYQTALHRLVKKNNLQGVEIVLQYGASTNVVDSQGNTPLWTAIHNKNLPMIQLLLTHTPAPTTGQQPHYQFLDQKEHIIEEPLLTAIRTNYPEAIAPLLEHEATGLQTNTLAQRLALHYAVNQRNNTILQLLLDHGADTNQTNDRGETALAVARRIEFNEGATLIQKHLELMVAMSVAEPFFASPGTNGTITLNAKKTRKHETPSTPLPNKKNCP